MLPRISCLAGSRGGLRSRRWLRTQAQGGGGWHRSKGDSAARPSSGEISVGYGTPAATLETDMQLDPNLPSLQPALGSAPPWLETPELGSCADQRCDFGQLFHFLV
ncbi:unnamed protein product [Eretmochelys imbricata]